MNKLLTIYFLFAWSSVFAQRTTLPNTATQSPSNKNLNNLNGQLIEGRLVVNDTCFLNDLVGIGAVTPTAKLHIAPSSATQTSFQINAFDGNSALNFSSLNALNVSSTQRLTELNVSRAGWMMAYNGRNASIDQQIGLAYTHDGSFWTESPRNPVLTFGAGGTFDDAHLAHPHLIKVNDTYYIYYSGYDGTNYTIGLATSTDGVTWTKQGQVLARGAGGTWDDDDVYLPEVIYEDTATAAKKWKMWYTGSDGSATAFNIGYAYSADGVTWTKYASNPVLSVGGAATFDEGGLIGAHVLKINSTYNLFYEGYQVPSSGNSAIGVATFTNPESAYTKYASNPVFTPKTTATQVLTANTLTGTKVVTVASTAAFNQYEYVFLDDANSTEELHRIKSIDSGTQLTLYNNVASDFTTAANAFIRSIYYNKLTPSSVHLQDGGLVIHCTAYDAISTLQRELCAELTATTPTTGWAINYGTGIFVPILSGSSSQWDYTSAENPATIPSPMPEELYLLTSAAQKDLANTFTAANTFSTDARFNEQVTLSTTASTWNTIPAIEIGTGAGLPAVIWSDVNGANFGNNVYYDGANYRAITTAKTGWIDIGAGETYFIRSASTSAGAVITRQYSGKISTNGNWHIGLGTDPTSANGSLIMVNSTAPASSPADQFEMYSADANGAGTAAPHFAVESGAVIKLYRLTALTTALTNITSSAPGTPDYAIQDLTAGGFGFVTADEGQTALSVIKNLQARVDELEARMKSLGILPP